MSDDAIKAALREAALAAAEVPAWRNRDQAAAAIEAFLRSCQRAPNWPGFASLDELAAAVARAAKEPEA